MPKYDTTIGQQTIPVVLCFHVIYSIGNNATPYMAISAIARLITLADGAAMLCDLIEEML